MRKLFLGTILLALAAFFPLSATAGVDISIGISLPPPVVFAAPPEVIVLPDTPDVYVVPEVDVDLFFYNGWWWRLWDGRWYRSHYYNRGWAYYDRVPSFYFDVDPGWRGYYRERHWHGHPWNYQVIPDRRLQRNWRTWNNNRYWEKRANWGVQDYRPLPKHERQEVRQERQRVYNDMPEVQRHMRQKQEPKQYQQTQEPSRQIRPRTEQTKQYQKHEGEYQQKHGKGAPEVKQFQQTKGRRESQSGVRQQFQQRPQEENHRGKGEPKREKSPKENSGWGVGG